MCLLQVSAEPGVKLGTRECEGLGGVVPSYTLHLLPPLTLYNHLPCTLSLKHPAIAHPLVLDPGHLTRLYHTHPSHQLSLGVQVSLVIDNQLCHCHIAFCNLIAQWMTTRGYMRMRH